MIGTTLALGLGGLALGTAGSFLSSKSNKKAATTAAQAQQSVATENNALARWMYEQNAGRLGPLADSAAAPNALLMAAGGTGDPAAYNEGFRRFVDNSDYGFRFGEGSNALMGGYAGSGTVQSGAAMKDLTRFRDDLQSGYRREYNALLDSNRAFGLGAGSALAGVGQNYVGTVTANNQSAADATSNAALVKGQYNPFANALGVLGGGLFGMAG